MKSISTIFILSLLLIFCSCKQRSGNNKIISVPKDNIEKNTLPKEERKEQVTRDEIADSLSLDKVLNEAIRIAKQNIQTDNYYKEYEITLEGSSYNVAVNIRIGRLFSKKQRHILIRRRAPWGVYIDIYHIKGNKLASVLNRLQHGMSYVNDTIRDVDGDGMRDFLVHLYPESGCCRRDIFNVYLNLTDKGAFSREYQFINPTFSPKEKIIRGVQYGHPGEVGLYKYKWNNFNVDTIEFIYPDKADTINHSYFLTNKELYSSENVKRIKLKSIPKEYRTIESFEWFNEY
ncbi:MAG: hypothetical protein IPK31_17020 [Chitinophagaceae bacterium]|nr:hypothetical protein [Chitinophagaceae bacterium]